MRNPLAHLVHRNPDKPTLRKRLAILKGSVARVMRRKPLDEGADPVRRSAMKGTLAAAAAIPLVGFSDATMAAAGPHPDQALLDAEAECLRADAAHNAATKASREARAARREALGPCPEELVMQPWEARAFSMAWSQGCVRRLPTHLVPRKKKPFNADVAWTAEALKTAIALAPDAFGPAGRTPHHIRRWRGLLPLAEAYDARHAEMDQHFRCKDLFAEERAADQARSASFEAVNALTATTIDGLAIKARHCHIYEWHKMSPNWASLLASAAAISGVTLRQSDTDEA